MTLRNRADVAGAHEDVEDGEELAEYFLRRRGGPCSVSSENSGSRHNDNAGRGVATNSSVTVTRVGRVSMLVLCVGQRAGTVEPIVEVRV